VSVSGILEPAYSIGGDSFDYALNDDQVDFAIIDAVGHGMPAVMMSATAINSMRNARRESAGLDVAYLQTGDTIEQQYGACAFVTAQFGSLDLVTGTLRWLNAGHPPPLLVRDGTSLGELSCRPSLPMGLGGSINEIADEPLQRGDRVLFFTDGVTESRAPDGTAFGLPRLEDYLVRITLDGLPPAEAVRRLRALIMTFNGAGLSDDATLLLIDYHGPDQPD
jgi:serine phosphatase RsbU (regulator of sigma subunit)